MSAATNEPIVVVGTYTEKEGSQSRGIHLYRMDPTSGDLTFLREVEGVRNPSYLAIHPGGVHLYSVNEVQNFEGEEGGGVTAFSLETGAGKAAVLNARSSGGKDPCYISIEHSGRFALAANYSGGNASMLPILPDGRLGPASDVVRHAGSSVNPVRQTAPFVHCIRPDPTNRFAIAADLGADQLVVYEMDLENGRLKNHARRSVRAGAGPRHFTFHPNGQFLYLLNELDSTLVLFRYDSEAGNLDALQTISALPQDHQGENLSADLHIHGNYLYASQRGRDSITWFLIDEPTGRLSYQGEVLSGGQHPRGFAIDPSGTFLLVAHERSNNLVTFRLDPATGRPSRTGHEVKVSFPVCIKFVVPRR